MIQKKSVTVVIPCRNEARGIRQIISRVPRFVDEIIVVDNRSTDSTARVARKMGATVVLESRVDDTGVGYGYALQAGIAAAKGDVVVTLDGDGTYPVEDVVEVVNYLLSSKLDFISCNRFPLNNNQAISWIRKLGIWMLNMETYVLYGYRIQDILSGMWVFKKSIMRKLQCTEGGWNFSPEIKINAFSSLKIRFGEYHINHHRREHENSKQRIWQTGFMHLRFIIKKRFNENSRRDTILSPTLGWE